jgi:hypothetical protein
VKNLQEKEDLISVYEKQLHKNDVLITKNIKKSMDRTEN